MLWGLTRDSDSRETLTQIPVQDGVGSAGTNSSISSTEVKQTSKVAFRGTGLTALQITGCTESGLAGCGGDIFVSGVASAESFVFVNRSAVGVWHASELHFNVWREVTEFVGSSDAQL